MYVKEILKAVLPKKVAFEIRAARARRQSAKFKGLSTQQLFTEIYLNGLWGKSTNPAQPFYSGSGSNDSEFTSVYVDSIRTLLQQFPRRPNAVDLGCGDFSIGSQLRSLCADFVACDIVPQLIKFNKIKYQTQNVEFRVLDVIEDELPKGDVVFIRQVLQHLSNEQIEKLIPKLTPNYTFLVLTEHLPKSNSFAPNIDKLAGPAIRIDFDSGIVLTEPPFNLHPIEERVICEVEQYGGLIRTTLYKLK